MHNDFTPTIVSATILQGSDCIEVFNLFSDELKTLPVDLDGFGARTDIKTNHDGKIVLSFTSADNIVMGAVFDTNGNIISTDPLNGCIAIKYNHAITSAIKFKGESLKCIRDVEIYDSTSVKRIVSGQIIIIRDVKQ